LSATDRPASDRPAPELRAPELRAPDLRAPDLPKRQERIPLAILYMVSASVLFAGSSAASKWLVATYPPGEILFGRNLVSLLVCAAVILPRTGLAVFRTNKLRSHMARSVSQATSQTFLLIAISMMPLASATAINFSAPLFATLASIIMLREAVRPARWAALGIGFLGVLLVAQPGPNTLQTGSLFALANAILFGTVTAGVRGMTSTESTETLTMYQMLMLTSVFTLLLPFGVVTPSFGDSVFMVLNGAANAIGQYWWTRALHLAPTSAVAPFQYLSLVWALVLGFVLWGDLPTIHLLIGSAIVVASGLFLLWRESTPWRRPTK
jgi:drug/metabolite transporter (DMT)-like permease